MIHDSIETRSLNGLSDALQHAQTCTKDLMARLIAETSWRLTDRQTHDVDRMVAAGAWADAALLVVGAGQPSWTLRRLVYEDGMWCCSLSLQPDLPAVLDDTADAFHQNIALAILCAFAEGRSRRINPLTDVPRSRPQNRWALCSENFA